MAFTVALIGNPNSGKTSLFNGLTGSKQQVGNWPGVTVEKKTGRCQLTVDDHNCSSIEINIVDLPGVYTLAYQTEGMSLDEQIASSYLQSKQGDLVLNIVNATQLERHLYLTLQLIEQNIPTVLVINMMDVAENQKLKIDMHALSQQLGIPVFPLECRNFTGLTELKIFMAQYATSKRHLKTNKPIPYLHELETYLKKINFKAHTLELVNQDPLLTSVVRLFEGDEQIKSQLDSELVHEFLKIQHQIQVQCNEEMDIYLADKRYNYIHQLLSTVQKQTAQKNNLIDHWLDRIVLHRFFGLPFFLLVMYSMFFFAMNLSGIFQDFFDLGSQAVFINGLSSVLQNLQVPSWFISIFAIGIGKGINTTVTFIPIIAGMYLFLSFLEDSGYMARATFVIDRLMQYLGLPGKAFIPLIVGFGCNVPAVLGTRILENERDRLLTMLMIPFMSCGARLTIFAVFTAAFFPHEGANIVFLLYLIGILCAILTGFLVQKTLLKGQNSPLILEIPAYQWPKLDFILKNTWKRLKGFLFRAGKLIIPMCVVINALNTIDIHGHLHTASSHSDSLLAFIGKKLTWLFSPLGLHEDNWPATVGILTGVLAKEVVIATLNALYVHADFLLTSKITLAQFGSLLFQALHSVIEHLADLGQAIKNPILASAKMQELNPGVLTEIHQHFDGKIGAFSYLTFVLLYMPCISTAAAIAREANKNWMWLSLCWNTFTAYAIATLIYQVATFSNHISQSLFYTIFLVAGFFAFFLLLQKSKKELFYL